MSSLLLLLLWVRKVGVPSTVVTHGLVSPPFSNSWAEILRMGVAPPDPAVDRDPVDSDLEYLGWVNYQKTSCEGSNLNFKEVIFRVSKLGKIF